MAFNQKQLYDALTRHQIYVEAVKAGLSRDFNEDLKRLAKELLFLFATIQFTSLNLLPKWQVNKLLAKIRGIQFDIYDAYEKRLLEQLRDFVRADYLVSLALFNEAFGMQENVAPTDKLWSTIVNAPVPANGVLPLVFLSNFEKAAQQSVINLVWKAYVNGTAKEELINEIIGTKDLNYKDGQLDKILRQERAVTSTVVQHETSIVQAQLGQVFTNSYMWASVLDNRTTEICISRNGNIYEYGKGPLPPAHIR